MTPGARSDRSDRGVVPCPERGREPRASRHGATGGASGGRGRWRSFAKLALAAALLRRRGAARDASPLSGIVHAREPARLAARCGRDRAWPRHRRGRGRRVRLRLEDYDPLLAARALHDHGLRRSCRQGRRRVGGPGEHGDDREHCPDGQYDDPDALHDQSPPSLHDCAAGAGACCTTAAGAGAGAGRCTSPAIAAPPVRTVAARTAASASIGRFAFMPPLYATARKRGASARASFGKGSGRTQPDHGVDAAARGLAELDLAIVRSDEVPNDRQPGPRPLRIRRARTDRTPARAAPA